MQSRWSQAEADAFVTRYAPQGVNADLAVRTDPTRLLGSDPRLVLHGGGNTSVKTVMKDMLGDDAVGGLGPDREAAFGPFGQVVVEGGGVAQLRRRPNRAAWRRPCHRRSPACPA